MKTLLDLSCQVLGKYFLSIESLRLIPEELVEKIFEQFCQANLINENDLSKIIKLLTDYHSDLFCTSFCYYKNNYLNLLTNQFYVNLLQRIENRLIQLDFSDVLNQWTYDDKRQLLNLIGQMENLEYLKLTYNQLDDDDIRLLTANHRIRSKALCNIQQLHLQGNHLTYRSARFLKALTSLETLYVSFDSPHDKSVFTKEFNNLHQCTCSTQTSCEEIINRGWISKISQLQSSTTNSVENHFYRKRRRVDHDESLPLIKLVRFCLTCQQIPLEQSNKKQNEILSNPKGFIDSSQANDLLACYL